MDIQERTLEAKKEIEKHTTDDILIAEYISENKRGNTHPISVAENLSKISDEVKSNFEIKNGEVQIKSFNAWDKVFELMN